MPDTCPHGFAPSTCLICATLRDRPGAAGSTTATRPRPVTAVADAPTGAGGPRAGGSRPSVRPDAVFQGGPARTGRSVGSHVAVVGLAVVVAVVAAWLAIGVVFAVLRVVELAVVAAAAGYAGYRLGVLRGRHQRD